MLGENKNQLKLDALPEWSNARSVSTKDTSQPPVRPKLGSELIEQMQRHMRECVALGTIALPEAVQLYGDWLIGE